jgi:hypothetical protein
MVFSGLWELRSVIEGEAEPAVAAAQLEQPAFDAQV